MKAFFDHTVPVSDAIPEYCLTCGEEGALVENGYDKMVQCDRCLHWFHENKTCCDYPRSATKHDGELMWYCGRCRAKRQMLAVPPRSTDVVIPALDFLECTGITFGDNENPTSKVLQEILARKRQGADIQTMVNRFWRSVGEPSTTVDLILLLHQKARLKIDDAEIGTFTYTEFASIDVSIVAHRTNRAFLAHVRKELGDVIKRGLRLDSLDALVSSIEDETVSAQQIIDKEKAQERLNCYLIDQYSRLTRKTWDCHDLWRALQESLTTFLTGEGAGDDLQQLVSIPLRGGHRACDLRRDYEQFLPPAVVGVAMGSRSKAEDTINIKGVRYRAVGLLEIAAQGTLQSRFRVPEAEEVSSGLLIFYVKLKDLECALCRTEQQPRNFDFQFCETCKVPICIGCISNWAASSEGKGNLPSCPYCRNIANMESPGVEKFMRDLHALLKHVISLNPKDEAGIMNLEKHAVYVPHNLLGLTQEGALSFLRELHVPVARQPDPVSERAALDMYRQDLGIGPDVPQEEVERLVRQQVVDLGNAGRQGPDEIEERPAAPQREQQQAAPPPLQQRQQQAALPPQQQQQAAPPPQQQQQQQAAPPPPQQQQHAAPQQQQQQQQQQQAAPHPPQQQQQAAPQQQQQQQQQAAPPPPPQQQQQAAPQQQQQQQQQQQAAPPPPQQQQQAAPQQQQQQQAAPHPPQQQQQAAPQQQQQAAPPPPPPPPPPPQQQQQAAPQQQQQQAAPPPPQQQQQAAPQQQQQAAPPPPPPPQQQQQAAPQQQQQQAAPPPPQQQQQAAPQQQQAAPPPPQQQQQAAPQQQQAAPPPPPPPPPQQQQQQAAPQQQQAAPPPPPPPPPPPQQQQQAAPQQQQPQQHAAPQQQQQQQARPQQEQQEEQGIGALFAAARAAEVELEITTTNKQHAAVWWKDRLYSRDASTKKGVRYRCMGGGVGIRCSTSITLSDDLTKVLREPPESSHAPACERDAHRREVNLVARVLELAAKNRQIIDVQDAVDQIGNDHLTEEDITNLRARQSYYKHKYTGLPKLPQGAIGSNEFMRQSHENIAALGETTKSGAGFLRFNDAAEKVALWVADECADKFNTATMVFVDGTFYVTPPGYHQVITISGAIGCKFVPLAWAIVPDRLESTYRLVFRELKRTVEARAGNFTPPRAMTDFEKGMRNALRDAWHIPLGDLRGCIFHALKAWYQRLRKYGLEGAYREKVAAGEPHSMLNKWLHQTFGLPCLPPRDVASAWNILKQRAPVDPRVDKFIAYLEKNFVGQGATWDPQCWAAEPSERHRTNNCAEGLHRALKSKFGSAHPNIQVFVEKLLRYHETVRQKLRSTDRRPMPALKSELDREELWKQMTDHSLTLLAYLERVGRINTVPQSVSQ